MATNHLGHFLLTVRLLPCLAEGARSPAAAAAGAAAAVAAAAASGNGNSGNGSSGSGSSSSSGGSNKSFSFPSRVVSVSSALHAFADGSALAADPQLFVRGYSATSAYANSKLAQVMFTAELRRRIGPGGEVAERQQMQQQQQQGVGGEAAAARRDNAAASASASAPSSSQPPPPPPPIVAVAVHPGEVLTDVVRSLPAPVVKLYRLLMSTLLLTPQEGARAAVFAATAATSRSPPDSDGDLLSSAWDPAKCYLFPDCRPRPPAPSVLDPVLGRWLWGYSSAKVGL